MMRSVGDALTLVWESDRSWSAARRGGEPLEGRGEDFMLDGRLHNVDIVMTDSLISRLIAGEFESLRRVGNTGLVSWSTLDVNDSGSNGMKRRDWGREKIRGANECGERIR